jgi:alcohol dehydrogenase
MKAAIYNAYGGPEVLKVITDAPEPTIEGGKILVEVHATSVNPWDDKLRSGMMKESIPLTFPVIIGGDFAGIAKDSGEEVYGQIGGWGATAELISVDPKKMAKKPTNLSFTEAASIVLVGISALQALEDHIHLSPNQKILIHGGSGGIGTIAIQIAKHLGAYVITTSGPEGMELVKELGADEVINYHEQEFEETVKDLDAVFDTVGGETAEKSVGVVKSGGVLVSMLGKPKTERSDITIIGQGTEVNTDRLDRLTKYIEDGVIKPQIDKTFTLDQVVDAYKYFESAHPKGKVAIRIKE